MNWKRDASTRAVVRVCNETRGRSEDIGCLSSQPVYLQLHGDVSLLTKLMYLCSISFSLTGSDATSPSLTRPPRDFPSLKGHEARLPHI